MRKRVKREEDKEPYTKPYWCKRHTYRQDAKRLVAENGECCYYFDGVVITKQLRGIRNKNSYITKQKMTLEDYEFMATINYVAIFNEKNKPLDRPQRSFEVNLYGGCGGFGAINKPYHYFSGK